MAERGEDSRFENFPCDGKVKTDFKVKVQGMRLGVPKRQHNLYCYSIDVFARERCINGIFR